MDDEMNGKGVLAFSAIAIATLTIATGLMIVGIAGLISFVAMIRINLALTSKAPGEKKTVADACGCSLKA